MNLAGTRQAHRPPPDALSALNYHGHDRGSGPERQACESFFERCELSGFGPACFRKHDQGLTPSQDTESLLVRAGFGTGEAYREGAEPAEQHAGRPKVEEFVPCHEADCPVAPHADPERIEIRDMIGNDQQRPVYRNAFPPVMFDLEEQSHENQKSPAEQPDADSVLAFVDHVDREILTLETRQKHVRCPLRGSWDAVIVYALYPQ